MVLLQLLSLLMYVRFFVSRAKFPLIYTVVPLWGADSHVLRGRENGCIFFVFKLRIQCKRAETPEALALICVDICNVKKRCVCYFSFAIAASLYIMYNI